MKIFGIELSPASPVVMTILNLTPDSFFAGSRMGMRSGGEIEEAVARARDEGASIIDVGGYSSRPGADDVAPEEEWRRVARGIEAVRRAAPGMAVSVDTFRADVARKAIEEFGPCIINDISGGELDPEIIEVAARYNAPYIAMHMRGTPADMQSYTSYDDVADEIYDFFQKKVADLRDRGVEQIVIDPGFGFAKNIRQNYDLLADMDRLLGIGCPILAGLSRKSMIYKLLSTTPEESLPGTVALNWEALEHGASILRVHDTRAAAEIIKMHTYYRQGR